MKTSKTIISVLGGVVVGAALGILFAPDKGENTRKKIAKKGNDAKDKAMGSLNHLLDEISEKCNSLINKSEKSAQNGIDTVQKELSTLKDKM
ncbi:MAG: YtxH domain-containing protein [Bacteroidota bacterium]